LNSKKIQDLTYSNTTGTEVPMFFDHDSQDFWTAIPSIADILGAGVQAVELNIRAIQASGDLPDACEREITGIVNGTGKTVKYYRQDMLISCGARVNSPEIPRLLTWLATTRSALTVKPRTPFHNAFASGMRIVSEGQKHLRIQNEPPIFQQKLVPDMIIIKMKGAADTDSVPEYARIFRGVNVIEYKGPDESVTAVHFYQLLQYAMGYLREHPKAELTASLFVSRQPVGLKNSLEKMGYKVDKAGDYIYHVKCGGEWVPFPIQIVVVTKSDIAWLKYIRKDLTEKEFKELKQLVDTDPRN